MYPSGELTSKKPAIARLFPEARLKQVEIVPPDCVVAEKAVYCLFGDECVISGTTNYYGGTENWREELILKVSEQENRLPDSLIFYDFQTFNGVATMRCGQYRYYRLEYKYDDQTGEVVVYKRDQTFCPLNVLNVFKSFVAPVPKSMLH
jgi:hypothetical protein